MLAKGTTLAGYRLDGVLGKGGMGVVYEATQLSLNRTVALKVLAPHLSDDDAFRERFRREGQIQAAIDHPNIVTVYEAGETEHGLFIAMRLVRGPTLKDMILARELDAGRSLRILRPVGDALDTAHDAGLIHRDIKPQNVLVAGRDHAYLADFGLTKAMGDTGLTRTGQFVGTLDYISPEQIRGEQATGRSDVYALAAVLFECLSGVVPYPRDSDVAVLYAHMSDPPPKVSEQRPDLPDGLDEVIGTGMAKDPAKRYASAGELLDAAEEAFDQQTRAAATPPGPIEVPEEAGIRDAEAAGAGDTEEAGAALETALGATVKAGVSPTVKADASPTVDAVVAPTVDSPSPAATPPSPAATPPAPPATPPEPPAAPPAPPTPSEPASTARSGSRAWWPYAVVGGVVAAVLLGVLLGHSGGGGSKSTATSVASAGSVQVSVPKAWSSTAQPPSIPGLRFGGDQIAAAPGHPVDGEAMVVGQVQTAGGPLLLPKDFLDALPDRPDGEAVKLGNLEGYRYAGLLPSGLSSKTLTLYTVPTSQGVATVACVSGSHTPSSFTSACARAAGSLQLRSVEHYTLGASADYASKLGAVLVELNTAIDGGKTALSSAHSGAAQASAALGLYAAYAHAAGQLGKVKLSLADAAANTALVTALRKTSEAYRTAASAAKSGNRAAYRAAATAVRKDARDTYAAQAALTDLGYPVE